jgi:hypothetical protein
MLAVRVSELYKSDLIGIRSDQNQRGWDGIRDAMGDRRSDRSQILQMLQMTSKIQLSEGPKSSFGQRTSYKSQHHILFLLNKKTEHKLKIKVNEKQEHAK